MVSFGEGRPTWGTNDHGGGFIMKKTFNISPLLNIFIM